MPYGGGLVAQWENGLRLFRDLIFRISIRHLLLAVISLLSCIALAAIGWNGIHVFNLQFEAEHLGLTNKITEQSLRLTIDIANERDFTLALLTNPKTNDAYRLGQLKDQRETVDRQCSLFSGLIDQIKKDLRDYLADTLTSAQKLCKELQSLRPEVDKGLQGRADTRLQQRWMYLLTSHIRKLSELGSTLAAPNHDSTHGERSGYILREGFFVLSEYTGLERAVIGNAIASGEPLSATELETLHQNRLVIDLTQKKIKSILKSYPQSNALVTAQRHVQEVFYGSYERLRKAVLQASRSGAAYPVDALEWFSKAARALNSIERLSQAFSLHIEEDIQLIKQRADLMLVTLVAIVLLVGIIFFATFLVTYRRIISPLKQLELATQVIGSGNLHEPINIEAKDEFGQLGQSLEAMRISLLEDRNRRRKAEQELCKLHQAIEQSVSSVVITDVEGITEYVNPCFEKTTGYALEEIVGRKFNQLRSGKTSKETYEEMWRVIKGGGVWEGELLNRKKNGDLFWDLVSISPVRNKENRITHFVGIQHNITDRKQMLDRLNFLAYHDDLTGLPNRTLLADRFEQSVKWSHRHNNLGALLIIDLDRFKIINDSLGHRTGDKVLEEVAERLKSVARESDTVSRYGGDEFVIILPDIEEPNQVKEISKRIARVISKPIKIQEQERILHVNCSIGAALWPQDGDTLDSLLSHADAAMYISKEKGGDQFQFFTSELNEQVQLRLSLEADLRQALALGELELHYQPQANIHTGKLIGVEALLRWQHPQRGAISPARFIPLAEETGLILPIGAWVLDTACAYAKELEKRGYQDLVVAVNISVRQLEAGDMKETLVAALDKYQLKPESIELEITESVIMHDPEEMIKVLTDLKAVGVRLAMDDFGTGHSSLSYLQRFPFDKLKIDRSFVNNITTSEDDAAIIYAINSMATNLNLEIIAEGVETKEQLDFLMHCGCNEIQGYLISKPLPPIALESILERKISC